MSTTQFNSSFFDSLMGQEIRSRESFTQDLKISQRGDNDTIKVNPQFAKTALLIPSKTMAFVNICESGKEMVLPSTSGEDVLVDGKLVIAIATRDLYPYIKKQCVCYSSTGTFNLTCKNELNKEFGLSSHEVKRWKRDENKSVIFDEFDNPIQDGVMEAFDIAYLTCVETLDLKEYFEQMFSSKGVNIKLNDPVIGYLFDLDSSSLPEDETTRSFGIKTKTKTPKNK